MKSYYKGSNARQLIFVDTNIIRNYLYETALSDKAEQLLCMKELCTSGIILNETLFVIARTKAFNELGIKNVRSFRSYVSKKGYSFCECEFEDFYNLLELVGITLFQDYLDKDEFILLMKEYKLLPSNALIAATCKHYGILKIATFDPDFARVDFLEMIV